MEVLLKAATHTLDYKKIIWGSGTGIQEFRFCCLFLSYTAIIIVIYFENAILSILLLGLDTHNYIQCPLPLQTKQIQVLFHTLSPYLCLDLCYLGSYCTMLLQPLTCSNRHYWYFFYHLPASAPALDSHHPQTSKGQHPIIFIFNILDLN